MKAMFNHEKFSIACLDFISFYSAYVNNYYNVVYNLDISQSAIVVEFQGEIF